MPIQRTYQCDSCEGSFKFMHHPRDEPPPSFCPICGEKFDGEPGQALYAPMIAKAKNQSYDQVYRQMEATSRNRADQAYETGGGDRSDYNMMHVTNMKDKVYEGETSVIAPPSEVQKVMQAQGMGSQSQSAVMEQYGGMLKQGPAAGSNAIPMMEKIRASHANTSRRVAAQGEVARHTAVR